MTLSIRIAGIEDVPDITSLIEESVNALCALDYTQQQIEGALKTAWGVDTQLISDETYFVVEKDRNIVGCGGWSYRDTLFGNDSEARRSTNQIDPHTGAAKIRAFFVKPAFARQGIGSLLMAACGRAAKSHGFNKLELMATLPGQRLYEIHGFISGDPIEYPLGDKLCITFVPMSRSVEPSAI